MKRRIAAVVVVIVACVHSPLGAQTFTPGDSILQRIWIEGTERSQIQPLAQVLMDSIGPRLTGSPGQKAAQSWILGRYREWGIPARNEQYGTWRTWRRGPTHLDLIEPRVRTLEGTMLAWSPGTAGPVTGEVVPLPENGFASWLSSVRGKYVLVSVPQPSCRPEDSWRRSGTPESIEAMTAAREAARDAWALRVRATGLTSTAAIVEQLEAAGVAGVLTSSWTGGWGVDQIHSAATDRVPMLDVSCEDYGLLARLAMNGQGPVIRLNAQAEDLGEQPVSNTIAEIRGRELPDEYIVLSAHFDSWDAASGATDNGTGTIAMLEAMRILRTVYPQPKRSIVVAHWSGEEQGLDGSEAFVADHPEIVAGLQALFNQDTGTGRVNRIATNGFAAAGSFFERWLPRIPEQVRQSARLDSPGVPRTGGSDYSSFICAGAPSFELGSVDWDYGMYTWHSNRDTFDKVIFDDVRANAVLIAMLAYLAAEDERIPRDRVSSNPRGEPVSWPTCRAPTRSSGGE